MGETTIRVANDRGAVMDFVRKKIADAGVEVQTMRTVPLDDRNPKDLLGSKKPPLHLVPPALALWVSRVFGFSAGVLAGANGKLKEVVYGPYNWRSKKVLQSIYLDAIERHLLAIKDGEWFDSESGLPHAAHIGANVAILLDAAELLCLIDDLNWQPGKASELIAKLTQVSTKDVAQEVR